MAQCGTFFRKRSLESRGILCKGRRLGWGGVGGRGEDLQIDIGQVSLVGLLVLLWHLGRGKPNCSPFSQRIMDC